MQGADKRDGPDRRFPGSSLVAASEPLGQVLEIDEGPGLAAVHVRCRCPEPTVAESLTSGETLSVAMLRVMRGKALAAMGNDDLATSELEGVLLDVRAMGARLVEMQAATELASIARRRGDIERARAGA